MNADRPPVRLPAEAEDRLHRLWKEVLRRRLSAMSRDELRDVARQISSAALAASILPEQLLIAVKASWNSHTEFRQPEERYRVQWVLSELVSLCIVEYYRAAAGPMVDDEPERQLSTDDRPERRAQQRPPTA